MTSRPWRVHIVLPHGLGRRYRFLFAGAYSTEENAEKRATTLRAVGYDVEVSKR